MIIFLVYQNQLLKKGHILQTRGIYFPSFSTKITVYHVHKDSVLLVSTNGLGSPVMFHCTCIYFLLIGI